MAKKRYTPMTLTADEFRRVMTGQSLFPDTREVRPARRKPNDEEHVIQAACVAWFRKVYPNLLLASHANGGKKSAVVGARQKAEGVLPGAPDLVLYYPSEDNNGLHIEMKTATGRQSEEQKEWEKKARAAGYEYVICRSFEDFKAAVEKQLKNYNKMIT